MKRNPRCIQTPSSILWLPLFLVLASIVAASQKVEAAPADALVGRWNLTIQDPNHKQLPSWLELSVDQGVWKANFVGRWGNARLLPTVVLQGDQIQFVSPRQEEDSRPRPED